MRADRGRTPSGRRRGCFPADPPSLTLTVDLAAGRLRVTGLLDDRTTLRLYDAVSALLRADQPEWTLDVTGLTVADHAGLRAIADTYRRALRHHHRITLHGAAPALQHALTRLRLDRHVLPGAHQPRPADSRHV